MRISHAFVLFLMLFLSVSLNAQTLFTAGDLKMSIDSKGRVGQFEHTANRTDYLYRDTNTAILTIVKSGRRYAPTAAAFSKAKNILSLQYQEAGVSVEVKIQTKKNYLALEVVKAEPMASIEAVVWGPLPLKIKDTVAEVIGLVRNNTVAMGMLVLNVKTLGGWYRTNEGMAEGRGEAALTTSWGSTLQAYSINRDRPRHADVWNGNYRNMPLPPIKGETVNGSRIALFSCAAPKTLDLIESIILAEKLPHPTINNKWIKRSAVYGHSYLISSFNEAQVDSMLGYTKRAGLISLYHEGPFKTWGHYELNPEFFPAGVAGMRKAVEKAKAAGLFLGVHTLTNFINTDDRYVSPVPDDRLSKTGSSILVNDVDASATSLVVESPEYFAPQDNNWLHTVKIGKELIRYRAVSASAPYTLLDCERGAFGTRASAHAAKEPVDKLLDHPYMVFFPNLDLQNEICNNLVKLFNETGINHWDFDGHEGGLGTGEGDYGVEMFSKKVTEKMDHEYLVGTSNSRTYYWYTGSYYNWGEPWYGGFKESMEGYRISNQAFFDRNYMPRMLGWYLLTEYTTLADMEWMLARAAGYGAGFAMVARPDGLRSNPLTGELLDAIREWETARHAHAFSAGQQERLKDPKNEFHLEKIADGRWNLYQYLTSPVFTHSKLVKQPGEPTYVRWTFDQQTDQQPLTGKIKTVGTEGTIKIIKLVIDNGVEISIPGELKAGESLVIESRRTVLVLDSTGKRKSAIQLPRDIPVLSKGAHTVQFDAQFAGDNPPTVEAQFKWIGQPEPVEARK